MLKFNTKEYKRSVNTMDTIWSSYRSKQYYLSLCVLFNTKHKKAHISNSSSIDTQQLYRDYRTLKSFSRHYFKHYGNYLNPGHYWQIDDVKNIMHKYRYSAISALEDYCFSSKSIKLISKSHYISTSALNRLRSNPLAIGLHNELYMHQITLGQARTTKFYNHGLKGLIGASDNLQSPLMCKYYQDQLYRIRHDYQLVNVISTNFEQNGSKNSDNKNCYFYYHDLNAINDKNNAKKFMAFLSSKLFISGRNGKKGRIIFYRNSRYKTLSDIRKANRIVEKYDISCFGTLSHDKWLLANYLF